MSDENVGHRVILGGAQRAAALAVSSLLAAGAAVIVLRRLGVAAFGHYGTVMSLVGIVYALSDLGLTVTGIRELALCETAEQRRTLASQILGMRIVITVFAVIAATAFAAAVGYESSMIVGTAVAGIGVIMQSTQAAMLLPLNVQMRNGALAVNQVVQQLVLLLGCVFAATSGGGIVAFCAIQVLIGGALLLIVPLLGTRDIARPRVSLGYARRLAKVWLPVAVASVVGVLYVRVLVVLMSLLSSRPDQVGYFVTCTRMQELASGLPILVLGIVLPVATVAAKSERERLVYMTGQVAQLMLLLGILAAFLIWTLAPVILNVAGGRQYLAGTSALQIQSFALVTVFLGVAWQTALVGMGQLRTLTLALLAGLVVLVVTGLVLIPQLQADGAALATLAGDAVLCVFLYVGLHRATPGEWLPLSPAIRLVGAGLVAAFLGVLVTGPAVVRAILVVGVFTVGALMARTLPDEILDVALAAIGRPRSPRTDAR